jgi:hypothetical protein
VRLPLLVVLSITVIVYVYLSVVLVLRLFPYGFAPLLDLRPLIFGVTLFGWLRYVTLSPTRSIISDGNIIFYLRPL